MMASRDPDLRAIVDEVANALQAAVLIAEHLERTSGNTAQDAVALTHNLRRVTRALEKLRKTGVAS
jgi:hypothetical protein